MGPDRTYRYHIHCVEDFKLQTLRARRRRCLGHVASLATRGTRANNVVCTRSTRIAGRHRLQHKVANRARGMSKQKRRHHGSGAAAVILVNTVREKTVQIGRGPCATPDVLMIYENHRYCIGILTNLCRTRTIRIYTRREREENS